MQLPPYRFRVKLFALFRERLNRDEWLHEAQTPLTALELLRCFFEAHPELAGLATSTRVAVNHRFATQDLELSPSDELALIPPVSGG